MTKMKRRVRSVTAELAISVSAKSATVSNIKIISVESSKLKTMVEVTVTK